MRVATKMVPAEAVLGREINAKKMRPGEQFQAKLSKDVQLKNGVELPKGTELIGTVATDNTGNGESTLALDFAKAELKNGKTVPIQATVIGISKPEYGSAWDGGAVQPPPAAWNGKTLQVDQIGAVSGVDLHSRIAGKNSAVFVSKSKDNMKLSNESQLSLAIAAKGSTSQMNGGA